MKKIIILLLIACSWVNTNAYDMMHLLQGGYDAKTLSVTEMDEAMRREGEESNDGRYKLEYKNKTQLYRHSFFADYYLYDTQKKDTLWLGNEPVRDAIVSANGKYVVYAKKDNQLYIYKVDFRTEVAVTTTAGDVYNGISDWLYEEEFGTTRLFAFSPDSKQLAFVRLDEREVPSFQWQTFLGDEVTRQRGEYPETHSLRYPRAGAQNAKASVCVYDIYYKTIKTMDLPIRDDSYIPRLRWTAASQEAKGDKAKEASVVALVMNRDQTKMEVMFCNPKSTVARPFYKEESKTCYVDFMLFDEWQWLSDGRVIVLSEKGGFYQAYMYSAQGIEQALLTPEKRDVMKVYGYDEKTQILFYQTAVTPTTRQCFALNLKKKTSVQLTSGEGVHKLHFKNDMTRYIDCYESADMPAKYTMYEVSDALKRKGDESIKGQVLLDNQEVLAAWKASGMPDKEYFQIQNERGDELQGWMIKPVDFSQKKKYPVVMMQYSGPGSQRVMQTWRKRFGHCLAAEGYVVVCVDGRGTNARGREWRNATYMQLGKKEAEDQISVAHWLKTLPYVDADKIALMGWSYGGYQTLMCMSKQLSPIWQCGIAIAPVTSWRLYDSAYTERYMRRPQVNEYGYEGADVAEIADQLQGELLLVHGLADDNVHAQHTWLYVDALVQAGKQFEMQMYPDDNHFLRARKNYEHLHKRVLKFLNDKLKQ
jgi:dipeptidyl-peptidase-4